MARADLFTFIFACYKSLIILVLLFNYLFNNGNFFLLLRTACFRIIRDK